MTTLELQQQALLKALFVWPAQDASRQLMALASGVGSDPQRGLKAYQSNGHMLAERALAAAYPVLVQIVGAPSFADLARDFWHSHPPERGDLAQWGQGLAEFLRGNPQLHDTPYVADVARVEWAMHRCAVAADLEAVPASFALLTSEDPKALVFRLAPGWTTVVSDWPVTSIVLAHLQGEPRLEEVGRALQHRDRQDAVIWRSTFQPKVRPAMPGERAMLDALGSGQAIEPALERAVGLDFSQWLPMAVQTGLVLGVDRLGQA